MQIAIDIGNSHIKVGFFDNLRPVRTQLCTSTQLPALLRHAPPGELVFSSVRRKEDPITTLLLKANALQIQAQLPGLPIQIAYEPPDHLGADRIAATAGAYALYPQRNCLVVDTGTCITYTLLDKTGCIVGGTITAGLHMRLKALHTYTANLPITPLSTNPKLIGSSTKSGIQAGVWHGIKAEMTGLIHAYCEIYEDLLVISCGRSAKQPHISTKTPIFTEGGLVLIGLRYILQCHNAYLREERATRT